MNPIKRTPLFTAVQCALLAGVVQTATAQTFPAEIELSDLDGTSGFVINGESEYDGVGRFVSDAGDINGDGIDDLVVSSRTSPGRVYLVFGSSSGFPNPLELSSLDGVNGVIITGEEGGFGLASSAAGDMNGDGIDDLILGAPGADSGSGDYSGRAYLLFGSRDGFPSPLEISDLDGNNGVIFNGESENDGAGRAVSGIGDVNGDGVDDLVIGALNADPNGDYSGRSYLVFGSSSGFSSPIELSALDGDNGVVINGEAAYDYSGRVVSEAGDINDDGVDDVLIGAPNASPNGTYSGRAYVIFGSTDGFSSPLELSAIDGSNGLVVNGELEQDYAGRSVSAAGDFNGDGVDDFIIGVQSYSDYMGRSYMVFGASSGLSSPLELSALDGSNGFEINGEAMYDEFALMVREAGDVNGDGIDDVIIGAPGADDSVGRSYVLFGSRSGFASPFDISALDGLNGFAINGESTNGRGGGGRSGRSVSGIGDVNGDGVDDVLIGASSAYSNGARTGRAYVVFGRGLPSSVPVPSLNGLGLWLLGGLLGLAALVGLRRRRSKPS